MFEPTQPAQQTRSTTTVAQPSEKCWTDHSWAEAQARRQDLAVGGAKKQKRGATF